MNTPQKTRQTHLLISGIIFTAVLFAWPLLMMLTSVDGTVDEQLIWIGDHLPMHKLQFILAFLLAPSILYLHASQTAYLQSANPSGLPVTSPICLLGWLFLSGYLVLNSIAYASQVVILPHYITGGLTEQALAWFFHAEGSVAYFFNQLGYCFWGAGVLILFSGALRNRGIIRYIAGIYVLSALLSVLAFTGLIAGSQGLNDLTFFSGIVLVPVGILTIFLYARTNPAGGTEKEDIHRAL